ncbi:MAG: LPXTG cell wall anchor domain-containing protein, partial [Actinomycetota bacterium]
SNTFDCTRQGNAVRCTLDELAVGASAFIGIDVTVPIGTVGNVPNTAEVSGRVPDPNPNNNADTDVVNVPAGVLPDTGSDMGNTLRIAGLILTAGLALVVLTLRRRREQMAS